jgi:hypothetical protein
MWAASVSIRRRRRRRRRRFEWSPKTAKTIDPSNI